MAAECVIQGNFADFKLVKTRSTAQMIIEVPIEQAESLVQKFGIPQAATETPVVVARLTDGGLSPDSAVSDSAAHEAGNEMTPSMPAPSSRDGSEAGESADKPRTPFHELPLSQQCAIRCGEPAFQIWLFERHPGLHARLLEDSAGKIDNAGMAAEIVREWIQIASRAELYIDPEAAKRWQALETDFLMETGRMARP